MSRKPRLVLPAAIWAKIQAEYEAGVPVTYLASTYNITPPTIYTRKKKHGWSRDVSIVSDDMLSKAKKEAEERVLEHIHEREVDMKQVVSIHKNVSQQIMERAQELLISIDDIPNSDVSKKAHALKVVSDVITAQIRNERKTWNIDERGADTSLEALLDELEGEENRRTRVPRPVVVK